MSEKNRREPSSDALDDLDRRLKELRQKSSITEEAGQRPHSSMGQMMWLLFHVISDLLAGVLCGLGIGYGLDKLFQTYPIFFTVFLVLGSAAGVLNAVRFILRQEKRDQEASKNLPETTEQE